MRLKKQYSSPITVILLTVLTTVAHAAAQGGSRVYGTVFEITP